MTLVFRCYFWLPFLVCSILVGGAHPAQARPKVYSVNIGYNSPPPDVDGLDVLQYADDDAARLHGLLASASDQAFLLVDLDRDTRRRYPHLMTSAREPSMVVLQNVLARIVAQSQDASADGERATVFLSFSGHGAISQDGEPYLVMSDGRLTRRKLRDEVLSALRGMNVHLLIDACHAGAMVSGRGAFDEEMDAEQVNISDEVAAALWQTSYLDGFPRVGALIATAPDQQAHEWSRIESGVFTHEVVSALRGAADINGDLRVTYSELQAFVASANRKLKDPRARPDIRVHSPRSNPSGVLLDLTTLANVRWLHGDPGGLGRFRIEMDSGECLLEAHLAPGRRAALVLPVGQGAYVLTSGLEARVSDERGIDLTFARLTFVTGRWKKKGAIEQSLRADLFATAYTVNYYNGYVEAMGMDGVDMAAAVAVPLSTSNSDGVAPAPEAVANSTQSTPIDTRALAPASAAALESQLPLSPSVAAQLPRPVDHLADATGSRWYKQWWVWTVAGVVITGAALGVVAAAGGFSAEEPPAAAPVMADRNLPAALIRRGER